MAKANSELKYAVLAQIPLELAIVEWGIQKTQNARHIGESDDREVRISDAPSFSNIPKATAPAAPISPATASNVTQQEMAKYDKNDALWTALVDKVKTYNHSIAGVLRGCRLKSYDNKTLLIETNFKFHKDKLSEDKAQEILGNALKEVTRKNVKIEIMLGIGVR